MAKRGKEVRKFTFSLKGYLELNAPLPDKTSNLVNTNKPEDPILVDVNIFVMKNEDVLKALQGQRFDDIGDFYMNTGKELNQLRSRWRKAGIRDEIVIRGIEELFVTKQMPQKEAKALGKILEHYFETDDEVQEGVRRIQTRK